MIDPSQLMNANILQALRIAQAQQSSTDVREEQRQRAIAYTAQNDALRMQSYARYFGDAANWTVTEVKVPNQEQSHDQTPEASPDPRPRHRPVRRVEVARQAGSEGPEGLAARIARGEERLSLKNTPLFGFTRWRFDSPFEPLKRSFLRWAWGVVRA